MRRDVDRQGQEDRTRADRVALGRRVDPRVEIRQAQQAECPREEEQRARDGERDRQRVDEHAGHRCQPPFSRPVSRNRVAAIVMPKLSKP